MFQNLRRMLSGGSTLKLSCEACGHEAAWTRAEALQRLGGDATPCDIRRRVACSGCGCCGRVRAWI